MPDRITGLYCRLTPSLQASHTMDFLFGPSMLRRKVYIHLLLNKLQPAIDRRLRLRLLLLQQHGSDQFVDG